MEKTWEFDTTTGATKKFRGIKLLPRLGKFHCSTPHDTKAVMASMRTSAACLKKSLGLFSMVWGHQRVRRHRCSEPGVVMPRCVQRSCKLRRSTTGFPPRLRLHIQWANAESKWSAWEGNHRINSSIRLRP